MPLSARKCATAAPGRHSDGRGLILVVRPSGARSWILRYQLNGRRRDLGLGGWPEVSLSDARERALGARRLVKAGRDPIAERRRSQSMTFKAAAEALIESKRPGWRNAKHGAQWRSTLKTYADPILGDLEVDRVDTRAVLEVLRPIWTTKPETASRVRQRIEAVLDYAAALEARVGDNPARWRGHLANLLPRPSSVRAVRHHAALDWRDAPALWAELADKVDAVATRALAFAFLTAARSGEVRGIRWHEIDLEGAVWTIPPERMKASREHRVPLLAPMLILLGSRLEDASLVFESPSQPDATLSDMALTAVLRRLGRTDVTVHGLRSTFRDWAGETTAHPREVIEAALAHRLKDKAEAAYARGDLFRKRRRLMENWAAFVTGSVGGLVRPPFLREIASA